MKKEEIEYIQNRLGLLNSGKKITWSLKDRQIVSALCIEATQQSVQSDKVVCSKHDFRPVADNSEVCIKCGMLQPRR